MKKRVLGVWHDRDLDGLACHALMKLKYESLSGDVEFHPKGWDYSYDPEELVDEVYKGGYDQIVMADVSLPMNYMEELTKWTPSFLWIDHHKSAIEAFQESGLPPKVQSVLNSSFSACELVSDYFGFKPSKAIWLLGVYDTWRKDEANWDDVVLPFQMAMKAEWDVSAIIAAMRDGPERWIESGKLLLKAERQEMALALKHVGTILWEGHKAGIINATLNPGRFADMVWEKFDVDLLVVYRRNWDNSWSYSLRSRGDVDCSFLAKQHGGGGHKGAAGFTRPYLLF